MGTGLTVPQLKAQVIRNYPRITPDAQQMFDERLETWIYELCDWPYWFLSQRPSPYFREEFPLTQAEYPALTLMFQQWADIGWLILHPGQTVYIFGAPYEDEHGDNPSWWGSARVSQIESMKVFTDQGLIRNDVDITSENFLFSRIDTSTPGPPRYAVLQTSETYSRLIIHPPPDRYYPVAIQFSLRECPLYTSISDSIVRSRFLNFASDAVYYKVMMQMAEFFDEDKHMLNFANMLYGAPAKRADLSSQSMTGGILGKLKQETFDKASQVADQVIWKKSASDAYARTRGGGTRYRYGRYRGGYYPL